MQNYSFSKENQEFDSFSSNSFEKNNIKNLFDKPLILPIPLSNSYIKSPSPPSNISHIPKKVIFTCKHHNNNKYQNSKYFSDSAINERHTHEIVKINKRKKNESKKEEEKKEEEVNINTSIDTKKYNNSENKKTTISYAPEKDITVVEKPKNKNTELLIKKRKRPRHTDLVRDNIKEKIKTSFFNSIIDYMKTILLEYKKLRPLDIIYDLEKIAPVLNYYNKREKFKIILEKKVKDLFYNDNLKLFENNRYKNKDKVKYENKLNEDKNKNMKNKEVITKIENIKEKIKDEKNEKIKNCVLKLYDILNTSLTVFYKEYIDNKGNYPSFNTIKEEIERQIKKGKEENYLSNLSRIAIDLYYKNI